MTAQKFAIEWIDGGREPKNPPDKRYPKGLVISLLRSNRHERNHSLPRRIPEHHAAPVVIVRQRPPRAIG